MMNSIAETLTKKFGSGWKDKLSIIMKDKDSNDDEEKKEKKAPRKRQQESEDEDEDDDDDQMHVGILQHIGKMGRIACSHDSQQQWLMGKMVDGLVNIASELAR
jgi:hypothetical protein